MNSHRRTSVLLMLAGGLFGIIASTQVWLDVAINDGVGEALHVAGADAIAVMAPLSLAAIALSITLAIVGPVFRYVLAAIAVLIGGSMLSLNLTLLFGASWRNVQAAITEATGIAGDNVLAEMVTSITLSPWVTITNIAWLLILAGGIFVLFTARGWTTAGKRFRTASDAGPSSGPLDKIDSWDDLSRGEDPTQSA